MSTYQDELGSRGRSWRATFYQAAKEEALRKRLGLLTAEEKTHQMMAAQTASNAMPTDGTPTRDVAAEAMNGAQISSLVSIITQVGTGAMPHETAKALITAGFPTLPQETINAIVDPVEGGSVSADGTPQAANAVETGTSEMMGLSTQQWNRNRKAIGKILDELASGVTSPAAARVFLSSVGMSATSVEALIADATDGTVDQQLPAEVATQ
jgi:hypothetical protein